MAGSAATWNRKEQAMRTTILLLAIAVMLGTVPATQAETGRAPVQLAQTTPPASPPAPEKLTGMAAWTALVGNTVVGIVEGKELVDYYLPDGTVKSLADKQLVVGKWALEGDKICFTYPTEPKDCYAMEVVGDTATFTAPTGQAIRAQIQKGNARNL
jgi:hypothetical protein